MGGRRFYGSLVSLPGSLDTPFELRGLGGEAGSRPVPDVVVRHGDTLAHPGAIRQDPLTLASQPANVAGMNLRSLRTAARMWDYVAEVNAERGDWPAAEQAALLAHGHRIDVLKAISQDPRKATQHEPRCTAGQPDQQGAQLG